MSSQSLNATDTADALEQSHQTPAPHASAPARDESDLVIRQVCLTSLAMFAETFGQNYRAARFHRLLARKLEDCYRRKIRRLCISTPPRHGKTLMTSVMFPAWALTKNPALHFIQAAYASELSEGFSRVTKAVLSSDRYRQLFPPILNPNFSRQKLWHTLAGGSYYATGVGGGAVGRGASIFIVDDATKNREEANSATHREKVWEWFTSTAMTRLSPDGVMIVIGTRWHQDDLIGRLTNPERVRQFSDLGLDDEAFEVLNLEAICENPESDPLRRQMGAALWPEAWPSQRLAAAELSVGPHEWNAQYQGRPNPPGGNLVDIANIITVDADQVPPDLVQSRGWDLALTVGQQSDFSVGARGGIHKYKDEKTGQYVQDFYLTHMHRGKKAWPQQKLIILNLIEQESIGGTIGLEAVAGFKIAAAELMESLQGGCIVKSINVHKDKAARANPWLAKIHAGRFYMVRGPWNKDFLNELSQFPNGVHDDQVDAVSVLWETVAKKENFVWS